MNEFKVIFSFIFLILSLKSTIGQNTYINLIDREIGLYHQPKSSLIWSDLKYDYSKEPFTDLLHGKLSKYKTTIAISENGSPINFHPHFFDNALRKRLILKHNNQDNQYKYGNLVWIEGIGSPNGIFYFYDWKYGTKTDLLCYFDRDRKRWSLSEDCRSIRQSPYPIVSPEHEYVVNFQGNNQGWTWGFRTYKFKQDSILIGNYYYHELIYNRVEEPDIWVSTNSYYRQEGDKVFRKKSGEEWLMYDFTWELGDTIIGNPNVGQYETVVNSIDSITVLDGSERKRIKVYCEKEDRIYEIVEGIGDMHFILNRDNWCSLLDGNFGSLQCFFTNGQLIYKTEGIGDCFALDANIIDEKQVRIYPNPAHDRLYIESDKPFRRVSFFNSQGLIFHSFDSVSSSLDISGYPQGLYFVRLEFPNGSTYVKKIVVARP